MTIRSTMLYSFGAIAGASMLACVASPASAFTLSAPGLEQPVASMHVDKVWYAYGRRGYYGWHGGYGYRGPYGWHGGYYYHPYYGRRCWRGYYGRLVCN
jgi:hypothetical protein